MCSHIYLMFLHIVLYSVQGDAVLSKEIPVWLYGLLQVDSVRCALEAEKKLREEVERRSLEAADECDILRSTTTALTNQLEEAQVHLSQLLMDGEAADNGHEPEVNSTDDDKNSSDDARVGQQISAFREQ